MQASRCEKEAFSVIGKLGSTGEGAGFVKKLWQEANAHFPEIAPLAKRDEKGNLLGLWGAMSDLSGSFMPWEDGFTKGLYLAGVEAEDDAEAPEGWVKWTIPGYEYVYAAVEGRDTFPKMIRWMEENGLCLAGAAHDFHCPVEDKDYIFFPIRRL